MSAKYNAILMSCIVYSLHPVTAGELNDEKGRYTMQSVDGGMLRLDTQTGAMSLCSKQGTDWSCKSIDDNSKAETEKARLAAENLELKDKVKDLESKIEGKGIGGSAPQPDSKRQLPTEQEVDQALDYAERMFKKFRDRLQKIEPPQTAPKPEGGGAL